MDLLDALKKKSSGPEKASPGKAEQLFEQYLQAREEGDTDFLEYVKESMELGYVPAIGEYGNILMLGVVDDDGNAILEEDHETGFEYELKAADEGYLPSMVRVGLHYFQGCGTEADIDEATRYWEMAAEQGAPEAKLKLAELYIMGIGEDQDYDEGLRLLDEAIKELPETPDEEHYINDPEWNLGEARFWKGMLYYYGLGQALNRYSAMVLFKQAQKRIQRISVDIRSCKNQTLFLNLHKPLTGIWPYFFIRINLLFRSSNKYDEKVPCFVSSDGCQFHCSRPHQLYHIHRFLHISIY